jgi:hypothetical protein
MSNYLKNFLIFIIFLKTSVGICGNTGSSTKHKDSQELLTKECNSLSNFLLNSVLEQVPLYQSLPEQLRGLYRQFSVDRINSLCVDNLNSCSALDFAQVRLAVFRQEQLGQNTLSCSECLQGLAVFSEKLKAL